METTTNADKEDGTHLHFQFMRIQCSLPECVLYTCSRSLQILLGKFYKNITNHVYVYLLNYGKFDTTRYLAGLPMEQSKLANVRTTYCAVYMDIVLHFMYM